eukprot:1159049-Pelagomonas_calceolata.AAC.7
MLSNLNAQGLERQMIGHEPMAPSLESMIKSCSIGQLPENMNLQAQHLLAANGASLQHYSILQPSHGHLGLAGPTSDGVNLINENDAWRDLFGSRKQLPHAPGPHAHKHLAISSACIHMSSQAQPKTNQVS